MPSILKKGRDFLEMPGRAIREGTHWVLGTHQDRCVAPGPAGLRGRVRIHAKVVLWGRE